MAFLATGALFAAPATARLADPTPLVDKFAPVIFYANDEPNLPASVDWFLQRATLAVADAGCAPAYVRVLTTPTATQLVNATYASPCGHTILAAGTRSSSRQHTFVIEDLSGPDQHGQGDASQWPLYYHIFKNAQGGWSIQYWCFYAYNTGTKVLGIEIGYHGGDWEMVQVNLDSSDTPQSVTMTGHTTIDTAPWSSVSVAITHPTVWAEKGGHEMHLSATGPPPYIRRETWTGGHVVMAPLPGPIPPQIFNVGQPVDLGTRLHPKATFLTYSGLWGSLGTTSSGYWGPPFNETGLAADSRLNAWCADIDDPTFAEGARRECYPDDIQ